MCIAEEQYEAQKLDIMKDALKAKPNYVMGSRQLSEAGGDREEFSPTPSDLSTVDEEGTPATSPPPTEEETVSSPPTEEAASTSQPPAEEEAVSSSPAVEEPVNGEVPVTKEVVNGEVNEIKAPGEDAVNGEIA